MTGMVFAFLVLFIGCGHTPEFYTPIASSGTVGINGTALNLSDRVYRGDVIETGKASAFYLRLDAKSYLVVYPETVLRFGKKNPSGFDIVLERGAVYVYSMDGKDLSLSAGNPVFDSDGKMRGWFYREGDGSGVRLSAGEMEIRISGRKEKTEIRPGFGLDVIGEKAASPMPLDQMTVDGLLLVEKAAQAGSDGIFSDAKTKDRIYSFSPSVWAESIALKHLSMESGPLSTVTTKEGRVYVGAVTVKGKFIEIRTLTGDQKVSSKDVLTVTRYQFL